MSLRAGWGTCLNQSVTDDTGQFAEAVDAVDSQKNGRYVRVPNQALEQTRDSVLRYGESVACELLNFFVRGST
jgi:hypothetical protein